MPTDAAISQHCNRVMLLAHRDGSCNGSMHLNRKHAVAGDADSLCSKGSIMYLEAILLLGEPHCALETLGYGMCD